MNDPHDPNQTADVPSVEADSLDAGLAAGFGRPADGPGSVLSELRDSLGDLRPVVLREAQGESAHVVKPRSDAMPPAEQAGDRYQLQGEIARGGMGVVLRGRDVDLGRDLAVKVLLEKHAQRPEVARRFVEEAQIAGQLQHPGVVPVYDIGRFGERPFFTMKLVKGQTLQALLSERTDLTADRPHLLGIALKVAQTLAYAHAKGVIHRDLKPANVMVGAFGEVQVMDWGLAKVLAEGGVADEERASRQHQEPEDATTIRTARSTGSGVGTDTEAGSLLGTPAYMPPEQANGDVALLDRRCDVFGLGAILCEILTGKPPYVGRSYEEVRRKAANGDLADAYALLAGCGADAELIALTKVCLSPEAIDRPRDAQAVAEGLTTYLEGVQQRLHQAELAEAAARAKAVEEAKRRRLTLALAGTVVLALVLGGGVWLHLKTQRDARQAQVTREINETLNKVTSLREQARAASAGGAALLAQAREQAQRALALADNGPADEALKEQVRKLQAELDDEEKDRQLLAALDEAWLAQAETIASKNRFAMERAIPKFREAFRAYGLPVGEGEPADVAARIRQRPARVREELLAALGNWLDLAAVTTVVNEPHREWLSALAEAVEPADSWTQRLRAESLGVVDWTLRTQTALQERDDMKRLAALSTLRQEQGKRRAALEKLAEEVDVKKAPVQSLTTLAQNLTNVEAGESAVHLLRRAQQQHPTDFWVNHNLGIALQAMKPPNLAEAIRFLTAAVTLRPGSAGVHINLGSALLHKGQVDESIACYRKVVTLEPNYAAAHSNLGNALRTNGQEDEAFAHFKEAVAADPLWAPGHYGMGLGWALKGRLDEATASYRRAVELDPKDANAQNNLGALLCDCKRDYDGAIACFEKAIALEQDFVNAHANLGNALSAKGQVDLALASYRWALALDPKHVGALQGVASMERLAAVSDRLTDFQNGRYRPVTTQEHLTLAGWCQIKKLYRTAAELKAAAFRADRRAAEDLQAGDRYDAASSAALAGGGKGEDAAKLDDQERARLRKQALDWLRADLALRASQIQSGQASDRDTARERLRRWQMDICFAGIRDPEALVRLPADERAAFTQLWDEVAALLQTRRESTPAPPVVITPPKTVSRQATPEQIADWVRGLTARDDGRRQDAAKALEEVGAPALNAVNAALARADLPDPALVTSVRDKIAVARALEPKRYTLSFKNMAVHEAVEALKKQTGLSLSLSYSSPAAHQKKITLALNNVPALEAVDRLCQAAGLDLEYMSSNGQPMMVLRDWGVEYWRKPPTPNEFAYCGPLRVRVFNMNHTKVIDFRQTAMSTDEISCQLELTGDRECFITHHSQPRVVEAQDDEGNSLLPPPSRFGAPSFGSPGFQPLTFQSSLRCTLSPSSEKHRKLKRLKLALPIEVQGGCRWEVLSTQASANASCISRDGTLSLKVRMVQNNPNPYPYIQFYLSSLDGKSLDYSKFGFALIGAKGARRDAASFHFNQRFPPLWRDEHAWWLAGGSAGQLPWGALGLNGFQAKRQDYEGIASFALNAFDMKGAKVVVERVEHIRTEIYFELHDLPLP